MTHDEYDKFAEKLINGYYTFDKITIEPRIKRKSFLKIPLSGYKIKNVVHELFNITSNDEFYKIDKKEYKDYAVIRYIIK